MGKNKEILKVMNDINKKYGSNSIKFGSDIEVETIDRIPTGSITLDISLGGGVPVGRMIQISGAFSSTKTTQTIHLVREAQKKGLVCSWFDAEGTTDKEYLNTLGVDTDNLIYVRPDGLEECTQMILDLQRSGVVNLAVIDTIEALAPIKEYESDMQESIQMGVKPKLLNEFCRKYQMNNNKLSRDGGTPFTVIAINQLREAIGSYGDKQVA